MELRRNPNGDITSVRVQLEDARFQPTYVHRSVEKMFTNPETGQRHTLRTFPLRLAYARTAYAAQGATLRGRVYVHIRNAFARGMAYVMLSRVPRRLAPDGTVMIKLVDGLSAKHIHPVDLNKLWARAATMRAAVRDMRARWRVPSAAATAAAAAAAPLQTE